MNDLKKEINYLEAKIDQREDADPEYLSPDLKELGHRILFVHTSLERSMEILIIKNINRPILEKIDNDEKLRLNRSILVLIDRLSFVRKLEILTEMNKDMVKPFYTKLCKINSLRNEFAHPEAFALRDYTDLEKKWKVLVLLVDTIEKFNGLFFK
ncbi:MAG TPA: hypothetical protein VL401_03690 [Alphaproteobacteria bacterium]|jgi:hypothetical protein|nr:hypothetical protein [Alphaproteobacteria bacterium]